MPKKPHDSRDSGLIGVAQIVAHKESDEMPYAELRGTIYWFRRRAPAPLQPGNPVVLDDVVVDVGKNGYVRFSLKTSDRRKARQLALKYAHLLDEAAAQRARMTDRPYKGSTQSAPLSPEEIQHAADTMYAQLLATDDTVNMESVAALMDGSEDSQDVREPDRHQWSVADLPPVTAAGQVELLRKIAPVIGFFVLQATGKLAQKLTPEFLPFADGFRRYVAALERRRASELVPAPDLPSREQALWSWDDALEYYYKQRGNLAKASKDNYRTAWNSLAAHAKGRPAELKDKQVVSWKDDLIGKIAARTLKTRLTFVKAIWMESRVNGKIPKSTPDPFDGLRVKVPDNVDTARVQFEVEELETIFASQPVQTESAVSVQAGYWLPLLALFHGARLEELTGLEVRDVSGSGPEMTLEIRENEIRPRLKNRKWSRRKIPVHPKLIELGFDKYVTAAREAGIKALFPSFTSGATFGEEFTAHVKVLISPVADRLVGMHCFRHNWETAERNGRLHPAAAKYITGRKIDSGSAALYGSEAGVPILREELDRIRYPLEFLPAPDVTAEALRAQDTQRYRATQAKIPGRKKAAPSRKQ